MSLLGSIFHRRPGSSTADYVQSVARRADQSVRGLCYPDQARLPIGGDTSALHLHRTVDPRRLDTSRSIDG